MDAADHLRIARKPRRAVRSATDGVAETERDTIGDPLTIDESATEDAKPNPAGSVHDAWWHEQRPPHWG